MIKLFFFDLETTGTEVAKHAIHQIAGKVIIDGKEKQAFNIKCRPFEGAEIDPKALEVGNVTEEQIMAYQPQEEAFKQLMSILNKWINPYNKKDKFFIAGYNIAVFDVPFLRDFFIRNGSSYYGSYFWSVPLDMIILAQAKMLDIRAEMVNFKQGTVAKALGIAIEEEKLHDALYDIDVCYKIYEKLTKEEDQNLVTEGKQLEIEGF